MPLKNLLSPSVLRISTQILPIPHGPWVAGTCTPLQPRHSALPALRPLWLAAVLPCVALDPRAFALALLSAASSGCLLTAPSANCPGGFLQEMFSAVRSSCPMLSPHPISLLHSVYANSNEMIHIFSCFLCCPGRM